MSTQYPPLPIREAIVVEIVENHTHRMESSSYLTSHFWGKYSNKANIKECETAAKRIYAINHSGSTFCHRFELGFDVISPIEDFQNLSDEEILAAMTQEYLRIREENDNSPKGLIHCNTDELE